MEKEGTWSNIGATHGETIASMGNAKMLLTSYVTWSLLDSGLDRNRAKKSVDWIRDNVKTVENNAYILALAANALAAYDAKDDSTLEVLQKLEKLHKDLPRMEGHRLPGQHDVHDLCSRRLRHRRVHGPDRPGHGPHRPVHQPR